MDRKGACDLRTDSWKSWLNGSDFSVSFFCEWIVALLASPHILESVMETISQPLEEEFPNSNVCGPFHCSTSVCFLALVVSVFF